MAEDANLKILKRRYANGEITKAEYDQMKEDLTGVKSETPIAAKTSIAGKASTQTPGATSPLVGVAVVLLVVAFVWYFVSSILPPISSLPGESTSIYTPVYSTTMEPVYTTTFDIDNCYSSQVIRYVLTELSTNRTFSANYSVARSPFINQCPTGSVTMLMGENGAYSFTIYTADGHEAWWNKIYINAGSAATLIVASNGGGLSTSSLANVQADGSS